MVGDRGIISALYSVPLLVDSVEQAEVFARRLEVIESGPVSYLASKVLIAAPQDFGERLT